MGGVCQSSLAAHSGQTQKLTATCVFRFPEFCDSLKHNIQEFRQNMLQKNAIATLVEKNYQILRVYLASTAYVLSKCSELWLESGSGGLVGTARSQCVSPQ